MPRGVYYKTEEHRKNLSEALKGHLVSEESRRKLSEANRGKQHLEEHNRKVSEALKGKYIGEKSSRWRGGTSFEPYDRNFNIHTKRAVLERDNYVCQQCGAIENLAVHHIDRDKQNSELSNLVTLCRSCHGRNHSRMGD